MVGWRFRGRRQRDDTEQGEVVVSVNCAERAWGDALLRVEVRDTGVGIEPDQIPRLFESFAQADSSTTRTHGCTGLGLAIARRLVELMGGQIGATSRPGRGSTFWFTARLAVGGNGRPAAPPGRDMAGLRVLVVDDHAANGEILKRQLKAWRMRADSADSAAGALERLRAAARRGEPTSSCCSITTCR